MAVSSVLVPELPWNHLPVRTASRFSLWLVDMCKSLACFVTNYYIWKVHFNIIALAAYFQIPVVGLVIYSFVVSNSKQQVTNTDGMKSKILLYKSIQTLCQIDNNIHGGLIMETVLISIGGLNVLGLFGLIKQHSRLGFFDILVFSTGCVLSTVVIVFCFRFQALLHAKTEQLTRQQMLHDLILLDGYARKFYRKSIRALRCFRATFGPNSYFEQTTPLVILNFCISVSINLILLF